LPTPATWYELQATFAPVVVQVAEVPAAKCAPVGAFAELIVPVKVVARAAEAVKAKTAKHAVAMLNFRIIEPSPYPIGVVPTGWCAPSSDVCPRLRNQTFPSPALATSSPLLST